MHKECVQLVNNLGTCEGVSCVRYSPVRTPFSELVREARGQTRVISSLYTLFTTKRTQVATSAQTLVVWIVSHISTPPITTNKNEIKEL